MRRNLLIPLVITLALGLAAGALVMRQSARTSSPSEIQEKTVKVVVMARDIGRGIKLNNADVALRDWPERLVTPQFIRNQNEAVGRVIIGRAVKDEPLLRSKLAPPESAEGLSTLIPAGYRAFTIRVSDVTGVAGFLLPGSRVDVHATFETEVPAERGTGLRKITMTRTILQDIEVLAAGGVQEVGKKQSGRTVPVVTLLLTPEQSDKVALASSTGTLWLSMRNARDKTLPETGSVTVNDLIRKGRRTSGGMAPAEAKPPPKEKKEEEKAKKEKSLRETPEALSSLIPEGFRAFSIRVTDVTGVAGFLLPGNRVDVHGTFEVEADASLLRRAQGGGSQGGAPPAGGGASAATKKIKFTKTILQDVEVLAAGGVREVEEGQSRIAIAVVTLLLRPVQADRLALAATEGKIWLSMRNPRDKKMDELRAVSIPDLFVGEKKKEKGSPRRSRGPSSPAPKSHVIEILQGGKKSHVEF